MTAGRGCETKIFLTFNAYNYNLFYHKHSSRHRHNIIQRSMCQQLHSPTSTHIRWHKHRYKTQRQQNCAAKVQNQIQKWNFFLNKEDKNIF